MTESIIKYVAKLAKRGAGLAGGGWVAAQADRTRPGVEFRELEARASVRRGCELPPELSRGTPRPHTSFTLFLNLASREESGETCAAAPPRSASSGPDGGSAAAAPSPDPRSLPASEQSAASAQLGGGRLQIV